MRPLIPAGREPRGISAPGRRRLSSPRSHPLDARAAPVTPRALSGGTALDELVDDLSEIVFQTDPEGNWTFLNRAWTDVLGHEIDATIGTHFLQYVHADERDDTVAMFMEVVSGGAEFCRHTTRYITADGGYRWLDLHARLRYDAAGQVVGNTGTLIDITDRRRAEELLADQTRILELIARGAPLRDTLDALACLLARDTGGTITISMVDVELEGSSPETSLHEGRESRRLVLAAVAEPRDGGRASRADDRGALVQQPPPALRPGVWEQQRVVIPSAGGRGTLGELALYHDAPLTLDERRRTVIDRCTHLAAIAIERRLDEDHVRRQALRDPLTGLANRALIEDRLNQAIAAAARSGHCVALLLIDLDRFKDVNDSLGHEAGDRVLQAMATRIASSIRRADTAGRLGGDEFAVILPEVRNDEYAERVTRKILAAMAQPITVAGISLQLEASVGIALLPRHGHDAGTLFRRADVSMYRAKGLGLGHAVFDPTCDEERVVVLELATELRRAIERDELDLLYQPQFDLRSGSVAGVEALVRWNHARRGVMSPDQFVPLAESTGLIRPLSKLVLRRALADTQSWAAAGHAVTLAVNLSVHDLHDPDLPTVIREALEVSGVSPDRLLLEITESAVMARPAAAVETIRRLAEMGVCFAIDDFGTGYSSLAYLKRLPARWLKIDRSFVRDMGRDGRDASIVRSAIDLGHTIGMGIVAEGVETGDVARLLEELGCDQAQGFALARPMAASAFASWLAARDEGRARANGGMGGDGLEPPTLSV